MRIDYQSWWNGIGYVACVALALTLIAWLNYKLGLALKAPEKLVETVTGIMTILGALIAIGFAAGAFVR